MIDFSEDVKELSEIDGVPPPQTINNLSSTIYVTGPTSSTITYGSTTVPLTFTSATTSSWAAPIIVPSVGDVRWDLDKEKFTFWDGAHWMEISK